MEGVRLVQEDEEEPCCSMKKEISTQSAVSSCDDNAESFGSIHSLIESDTHIRNLYLKDVRSGLFQKKTRLQKNFLVNSQVTSRMRTRLVRWLNTLSNSLEFRSQTFFVAVNLLDRYLSVSMETPK